MTEQTSQIVYVLTNPAMPGLVKIGKTTQSDVDTRLKQLYGTGVPVPFECAFACQVKDAHEVERAFHTAFGNSRINPNREFFKIEAERVIVLLRLLSVGDATKQIEQKIELDVPNADKESADTLKRLRRPRLNYKVLNIPPGSQLVSTEDPAITVTVVDERNVTFNGETCSLTAATRKVLGLEEDYALQPSPYWTFNGKNLKKIYDDVHPATDEE